MKRRRYLTGVGTAACGTIAGCLDSGTETTLPDGVAVETVTEGLSNPWGLAFLPDDPRLVVTERDTGRLVLVDREDGTQTGVEGVPAVDPAGQGGLLDVALHPEFAENRWIYWSYSGAGTGGIGTEVARGKLIDDRLQEVEVLFVMQPK